MVLKQILNLVASSLGFLILSQRHEPNFHFIVPRHVLVFKPATLFVTKKEVLPSVELESYETVG